MSELLRELEEEIQREKLFDLWRKHGRLILLVAVAVIIGTAASVLWREWQYNQNVHATAALSETLQRVQKQQSPEEAAQSLAALAAELPDSHAMLARFYQASQLLKAGQVSEAVKVYDTIAEDSSLSKAWRELAVLFSVMHQLDREESQSLIERLTPLTAEDSSWRFSAQELTAVLLARQGEKAQAAEMLKVLANNAEAPESLRARAFDLSLAYGANRP